MPIILPPVTRRHFIIGSLAFGGTASSAPRASASGKGSGSGSDPNRIALLAQFSEQIYGETPTTELAVTSRLVESSGQALAGRAIRQQLELTVAGESIQVLMYTPADATGPVPG